MTKTTNITIKELSDQKRNLDRGKQNKKKLKITRFTISGNPPFVHKMEIKKKKNHYMVGRHLSGGTKKKISEAKKQWWENFTPEEKAEHVRKMNECKGEKK